MESASFRQSLKQSTGKRHRSLGARGAKRGTKVSSLQGCPKGKRRSKLPRALTRSAFTNFSFQVGGWQLQSYSLGMQVLHFYVPGGPSRRSSKDFFTNSWIFGKNRLLAKGEVARVEKA